MLKNYFKIAWRNLGSKKFYSLINILGLAVGIFCCILIFVYVQDELSYDTFNKKSDHIFRVASNIRFGGHDFHLATAPAAMAYTLRDEYSEVKEVTRFREGGSFLVEHDNRVFEEKNVIFADSTLFNVFTFLFIQGDPKTALRSPNTVVLTKETALKYFGTTDVVGQTLRFDDEIDRDVTGVVKNLPHNSHFHFSMYVSMSTLEESREKNWVSNNFNTYVALAEGASPEAFEHKLNTQILEEYVIPQVYQILDVTKKQMEASGTKVEYFLQPLTDIRLYSNLTSELATNGNIQYIYLFQLLLFLFC